jgi:hypothetical protein
MSLNRNKTARHAAENRSADCHLDLRTSLKQTDVLAASGIKRPCVSLLPFADFQETTRCEKSCGLVSSPTLLSDRHSVWCVWGAMPTWTQPALTNASRPAYFASLDELDKWSTNAHQPLETIPLVSRQETQSGGRLLVCHDYKGGYMEDPQGLTYTFNWWDRCDVFI